MNSPHHPHHEHHDVHQQRLLWFFSFCNQRSSSSSSSSGGSGSGATTTTTRRGGSGRRKSGANRNKFATQYQQQLQQQQRQSSNVFGRELTEHTQLFSDDDSIPYIVKSCTRFIEKHGIIFGIYRLSGMRVNIHKLRQDFDKNPKISMIDSEAISNDAHAVACVLKQYFRELPTPLLTFHMYEKFIELFKHNNNTTITNTSASNNNNNNINININNNNEIKVGDNRDIDTIDGQEQNDDGDNEIIHDNDSATCKDVSKTIATITTNENNPTATETTTTTTTPMTTKSSLLQSPAAIATTQNQKQLTTSASDSQLISLSSVVTTTTSDIKYQVKLGDLRRLLLQLPRAHYQTLKFLMCHLACIAANGQKTGMDSKNVAIVWAPNLLKPRELELSAGLETLQIIGLQAVITEQLIKHHKFLFEDDENDIVTNTTTPSSDRFEATAKVFRHDKIVDEDLENRGQQQQQQHNLPPTRQQSEPVQRDPKQLAKEILDEHNHYHHHSVDEMRDEDEENNFSELK